jgi:hypothetical protein
MGQGHRRSNPATRTPVPRCPLPCSDRTFGRHRAEFKSNSGSFLTPGIWLRRRVAGLRLQNRRPRVGAMARPAPKAIGRLPSEPLKRLFAAHSSRRNTRLTPLHLAKDVRYRSPPIPLDHRHQTPPPTSPQKILRIRQTGRFRYRILTCLIR